MERAAGCRRAEHRRLVHRVPRHRPEHRRAHGDLLSRAVGGAWGTRFPSSNSMTAPPQHVAGLVANPQCSYVFDFPTRQKAGGTHLNFFIVKQLPVLPPETYTPALLAEIVPRVLELVYTAHDLAPFARACGYDGPPFIWDEERRAQLRAELDGIYAHPLRPEPGGFCVHPRDLPDRPAQGRGALRGVPHQAAVPGGVRPVRGDRGGGGNGAGARRRTVKTLAGDARPPVRNAEREALGLARG
ncbi:MAG: hypothetical protein KatS3mg061_1864 [Dehalococcoidia bacterium]|nr:MAG: hypothetical protein KatS3mg061_1864 [Dehalococcoidia bacterium]